MMKNRQFPILLGSWTHTLCVKTHEEEKKWKDNFLEAVPCLAVILVTEWDMEAIHSIITDMEATHTITITDMEAPHSIIMDSEVTHTSHGTDIVMNLNQCMILEKYTTEII
jgi:hypothetical protein